MSNVSLSHADLQLPNAFLIIHDRTLTRPKAVVAESSKNGIPDFSFPAASSVWTQIANSSSQIIF